MAKHQRKVAAAMAKRLARYELNRHPHLGLYLGPSDNRNQISHKPGSQNRKRAGYGG